ncbi:MAG TPA: hypothetical protein VIK71_02005 [Flavobacteriales bacterium]
MQRIKNVLLIGSIFAYSALLLKEPFEVYWAYVIYLIFTPFYLMRFGIPRLPVFLFLPLLLIGLVYVTLEFNTYMLFFKIFIGYLACMVFYYWVLQDYQFDVTQIYRLYMKAAVIVAIIGFVQFVSFQVGFVRGYNYGWLFNKWGVVTGGFGMRLNSVFSEPAYYGATMAPAFFTSLYNWISRKPIYISKLMSALIIITYILTSSGVAYIGVMLSIVFLMINYGVIRYSLFFIPIIILSANWAYENVPDFRIRWDSTIDIYTSENIYSYDVHGSSFVLYNNNHVAWENFKRNPLFGTGLGSHSIAFDKYSLTNVEGAVQLEFNRADANSMFLRLMSETGLYGLTIMIVFLFRHWLSKKRSAQPEFWVISNSCLMVIVLYLLRQGHYFINGLPFFIWLYYFTSLRNRGVLRSNAAAEEERANTLNGDGQPAVLTP